MILRSSPFYVLLCPRRVYRLSENVIRWYLVRFADYNMDSYLVLST